MQVTTKRALGESSIAGATREKGPKAGALRRKKRRFWRALGWVAVALLVVGVVARLWLPSLARDYVNRTLDRNPLYSGQIGEIKMHVWRGAYSIRDIRISKTT